MKVARLTATSVHHFRGLVLGIAVSVLGSWPLHCTCTPSIYVVHVRGTACLVRCIVVNCYGNDPDPRRGAGKAQQASRGRPGARARRRQRPRRPDHQGTGSGPRSHPDGAVLALPQQGRTAERSRGPGLGRDEREGRRRTALVTATSGAAGVPGAGAARASLRLTTAAGDREAERG